jgi:hypothetical protein
MKRILIAAALSALVGAPAYAGDWHRGHRDRGGSDVVDTLLKLQLFGLAVQAMQPVPQVTFQQRSLKDPYLQPYVQGDPLPPQRYAPLK